MAPASGSGGTEIIELVISWVVTNAFTFAVVILDERRLSEERLERAWPASSRDAAIVAFGILAVPVHFIKTRMHFQSARGAAVGLLWGILLGIASLVLIAAASTLVLHVIALVFGFPDA